MAILGRTCRGCFAKKPKSDLIAISRTITGEISVNLGRKSMGRSAYLCRNVECVNRARVKKGKNGLELALKCAIPASIWDQIDKILK